MFNVQTIVGTREHAEQLLIDLVEKNYATTGYIHEVEVIGKWKDKLQKTVQYAVGINCADGNKVKNYIEKHTDLILPSIFVTEFENTLGYELFNGASALADRFSD